MSIHTQCRTQSANDLSRRFCKIIRRTTLLAALLSMAAFNTVAQTGTIALGWLPNTNLNVAGYNLYYGEASGIYTSSIDVATNLSGTISGLIPGVTYYFASTTYDGYGDESEFSGEVAGRIGIPPLISAQPLTQTVAVASQVTLYVGAIGDGPLSYQWFKESSAIAGATNSFLSWPQIGCNNSGNYSVSVANAITNVFSASATLMVMAPPTILQQPASQTVLAMTTATFSPIVSGTAPLSVRWYFGKVPLAGATNLTLTWANVSPSNAGNYHFTLVNAAGAVTSAVVTLRVLRTNVFAGAAGVYNGLFYQTNDDGTPALSENSSGFLGNCVVNSNGAYTAKIYLGGTSCPVAGMFNILGNASAAISLPDAGLTDVTVFLQLDLWQGSQQMTGSVSCGDANNSWTAPLLSELAANDWPSPLAANLLLSAGTSTNAPIDTGTAMISVTNAVLSLSGMLGDTTSFSQTVPISALGNVPVYASLYAGGGLLAGWVHFSAGAPSGNLTWIRPGGILAPAGFPQGFSTVVEVTSATNIW